MASAGMQLFGLQQTLAMFKQLEKMYSAQSTWVVGTPEQHGLYQEYGTRYMPAQPHFRPTMQRVSAEHAQIAARADDMDHYLQLVAYEMQNTLRKNPPTPWDEGVLAGSYSAEKM